MLDAGKHETHVVVAFCVGAIIFLILGSLGTYFLDNEPVVTTTMTATYNPCATGLQVQPGCPVVTTTETTSVISIYVPSAVVLPVTVTTKGALPTFPISGLTLKINDVLVTSQGQFLMVCENEPGWDVCNLNYNFQLPPNTIVTFPDGTSASTETELLQKCYANPGWTACQSTTSTPASIKSCPPGYDLVSNATVSLCYEQNEYFSTVNLVKQTGTFSSSIVSILQNNSDHVTITFSPPFIYKSATYSSVLTTSTNRTVGEPITIAYEIDVGTKVYTPSFNITTDGIVEIPVFTNVTLRVI